VSARHWCGFKYASEAGIVPGYKGVSDGIGGT
jgi:hypothetical protein